MQFLIGLIPAPYRLLAGAIVLAVSAASLVGFGNRWGASSVQAKWDAETAQRAEQAIKAEQEARAKEQAMNQKLQEAQNAAIERETKLKADYAAAHAASIGLRDTVAALRSQLSAATAEAARQTADTALDVFSQCVEQYRAVAEAADGHASDSKTCRDSWPE